MNYFNLLLIIIFAHMFGDYFMQTNYLAMNKGKDNYILLVHCFLYGLGVYAVLLLFGLNLSIIDLLLVVVLHVPIDYLKARGITPKYLGNEVALLIDQFIHYITLFFVVLF